MRTATDAQVLLQLLRGQLKHGTHAERLQHFYAPQAAHYDRFRERLLHGRSEMIKRLNLSDGSSVVELGAGTGRNLLFFGDRLSRLGEVTLVDLCTALLDKARERAKNCSNVRVIEADATSWQPSARVDCVYFSYSLTMMPDWSSALDNALAMLKPGGKLGIVDFYVSQAQAKVGMQQHASLARWFWTHWFAHDGVNLNPAHLNRLCELLSEHQLEERYAPVPYLPGLRVPHYVFIGQKPG